MMDKKYWLKCGIHWGMAIAAGKTAFFDIMYPCPAALLTVTVGEKNNGWKLLLFSGFSLWLGRRQTLSVWADIASLVMVWLLLLYMREKGTAPVTRALGMAIVGVVTKSIVLWRLGLSYRYGMETAAAEAALLVVMAYIFFKMYGFLQKGMMPMGKAEGIIVVVCAMTIFLKGLIGPIGMILPGPLDQIPIVKVGVFFTCLWIGYTNGVKEGAVAGVTGGTMLSAVTIVSPAITTILACGGMAAGLCGNEIKLLAALVFSAVTLFFGLAEGMANVYLSIAVPILASLIFLAIPEKVESRIRKWFALEDRHASFNLVTKQQILQTLEGYRRTFQYLSRAYILQRGTAQEDLHTRSGRMIMAYQFKGMADAVERLEEEVRTPSVFPVKKLQRFHVKTGKAGMARDGQVSGDSVYCGEVKKGHYAVALSDGMGNGRRAAEESNLTVQTMYRLLAAGYRPELALRIMNSILLYRAGDEIYSTLDLALIDLYTGNLQLYKTGASLTLIRRGNQVEVVKIPALPMGIVGDIPVPSVEHQLRRGDQIILLSDGVAEAGRHQGIQWLMEAIVSLSSSDPQTVADLLIQRAAEYSGEKEKDDMTAVVIVVQ